MPEGITHDFLWDTPVQRVSGSENQGFLLTKVGTLTPTFFAHYVDGVVETINPPEGYPRPDPDEADRTKRVSLPESYRLGSPMLQRHGSRYSGQMRRVVQCAHSRGLESRYKYTWPKTHGILEFPQPRRIGSTAGDEATEFGRRRYWVVEIGSTGVYAAPLRFGISCLGCAVNLKEYLPTGSSDDLDLAWAFVNKNEGGAVLQVMTAAQIAPAYANGSPWYSGMGWAFSWSGMKASNVVSKQLNLPLCYETRLIDLNFAVTYNGEDVTSITTTGGVATATMAGHGFEIGELAVIYGATPDAYNGAHLVTEVTDNTFKFAMAGAPGPSINAKVANAAGNAVITAALTVGSAGRVIPRKNDLGTIWVPGDEQLTRWRGIPPFSTIVNASGPVHVFYDGEEKIVTNWSMSTVSVPLDQRLDQHPPDLAFTGNPNIVLTAAMRDYFEVGLWGGVTGSFHFWGGDFVYSEPVAQSFSAGDPGHPCSKKYRPTEIGSGHSYSGYTSLSWGFSGPFSHAVEAYSRRRINSVTSFAGDHYRTPWWDYSYGDRYYVCSGGTWDTAHLCIALFKSEVFQRDLSKSTDTRDENRGGSSALIMLPLEREAIAGLQRVRTSFANSQRVQRGTYRSKLREGGHPVAVPDHPACDFTNWEIEWNGFPQDIPGAVVTATSGASNSMSFALRASGGINFSANYTDGATPDLDAFAVYQVGVKESADSSLLIMRGGLEYPDKGLTPANQMSNHVKNVAGVVSFGGGFAPLPNPRVPVAFIGQV